MLVFVLRVLVVSVLALRTRGFLTGVVVDSTCSDTVSPTPFSSVVVTFSAGIALSTSVVSATVAGVTGVSD